MTVTSPLLPTIDDRNRPFWEGAKGRELRLLKCRSCGDYRYQDFKICPSCGDEGADWVAVSGKGKIWSFCFFHKIYFPQFKDKMPYNVIVVELDEGPRIYSNLVGSEDSEMRIGLRVEAFFEDVTEEVTLVKFQPSAGNET